MNKKVVQVFAVKCLRLGIGARAGKLKVGKWQGHVNIFS